MELLDGFDLQELVERFGPVPTERAVHLLKQICHSLAEAHDSALIHRDIKPANIYVCRYGRDADFVKVLDFGLVKPHEERAATMLDLTATFAARGTPAFMAPEQALGGRQVDGRADIYSLGCVGYWLVTGQRVFEGASAIEMIVRHADARPIPPSQRTSAYVPQAFDHLILACLEKNPEDRPQTADDVALRLSGIDTRAVWSQDDAHQWWMAMTPRTAQQRSASETQTRSPTRSATS
jgi:serine/threonine-protein kinase